MDDVSRELSRIIKVTSREFPSVNWNVGKNPSINNCRDPKTTISDLASSFYFTDRLGVSESHGDTSLHRLLAMHAPAPAVKTFLENLRQHHLYLDKNIAKGNLPLVSNTMAIPFDTMPPPPFLDQQNHNGVTALHMVVYRNPWHAETIVRMLLETNASHSPGQSREYTNLASVPMIGGSFPLHVLCGHNMTIQKEVLKLLLQADPTVVVREDRRGDNPFSLLWKNVLRFRWAISMESGETPMDCDDDDEDDSMTSWITVISPEEFLQYSLMMIGAFRTCRRDIDGDATCGVSLHEICSIPRCPPLLLRLSLSTKYRSKHGIWGQVDTVDENGMLPLHHAVQSPVATNCFVPSYFDDSGPASVVEILLQEYPDSVHVRDQKGRIPLHYALEAGTVSESVIMAMIAMYPDSVRLQDPVSGLYPFMLVAVGASQGRRNCAIGGYQRHGASTTESRTKAGWKQDPIRISYALLQVYPEVISFQ